MVGSPFDPAAAAYDGWFDRPPGSLLFPGELQSIRMVLEGAPRPWLEVGCGTGRFSAAIGVDWGIDPARGMLRFAAERGVMVLQGDGMCLPVLGGSLGTVVLVTALCFVGQPADVLWEVRRVLRPGGMVVVADIPAGSPWGLHYAGLGRAGHAVYRHARLLESNDVVELLNATGFDVVVRTGSVVQPPGRVTHEERGWWGHAPGMGFAAFGARKRSPNRTADGGSG